MQTRTSLLALTLIITLAQSGIAGAISAHIPTESPTACANNRRGCVEESPTTNAPTTTSPTVGPEVGTAVAGGGTAANPLDACEKLRLRRGFVGEVGVGHKFDKYFRTALLLQYRQAKSGTAVDGSSGRFRMYSAMLNGYLDAANSSIFTPYAMAGVGVGRHHTRIQRSPSSETAKKTAFIWNVGAGAQAKVNDNVSADLGYRYVYVGKLGSSNICPGKIRLKHPGIHEFEIGVVYNFDTKAKSQDNSNFVLANIGGFIQ